MNQEADLWFSEKLTPHLLQQMRVVGVLYRGRSAYQSIEVLELADFGRSLILDGKTQSTEADEFIYHEALVHPPLLTHPQPQRICVVGGGEGATLREVLRHRSVERVVMVDIDRQVIEVCRHWLPNHHRGAFDHPGVEMVFADARDYLVSATEKFDATILDITDPTEGGPSCSLFTQGFFQLVKEHLNPGGVMVVQAGACMANNFHSFTAINYTLTAVFPSVSAYSVSVPSFGGQWGFALGSLGPSPASLSPSEVDRRLRERVEGENRCYDGIAHTRMFSLPKYLREALSREHHFITEAKPLFVP